jgi:type IV pilus assembly protein PilX
MPYARTYRKNQGGYIIIAALLILALLTIISVSAIDMSTTELKIATNELLYEKVFYAAESGLQHLTELLRIQYSSGNSANLSSGGTPNWSFALQGAVDSDEDDIGDFVGSVAVLNRKLDNIDIQVRIWNNDDGGGPINDTDGLIYARSQAGGPRRARCRIDILLEGHMSGQAVSNYNAQAGGGAGKSFVSSDADVITDFTMTDLAAH